MKPLTIRILFTLFAGLLLTAQSLHANATELKIMTQPQNLPLFYRDLVAYDSSLHGKLNFPETPPDFRYAAATNIVPLLVHEVGLAVQHYPIVFLPAQGDEPPTLAVMVGIGDGINRYVDDGQWRPNTYIPAWVRRYPFLAVKAEGRADPVLALDPKAEWLNQSGGEALADADGQPTPRMERVLAFQREFQAYAERTKAIVKALADAGVLEEGSLKIQPPGATPGEAQEIKGFLIVNEKKLRDLPRDAVLALHKADAFGIAYAQLLSMGNLGKLIDAPVPALPVKIGKPHKSSGSNT